MKKYYFIFLFVLSFVLVACDSEDDPVAPRVVPDPVPDTVAPLIQVHTPLTDTTIMMFHGFRIRAVATDETKLDRVRFLLLDTQTSRMHFLTEMEPWHIKYQKHMDLDQYFRLPKYSDPGAFRLIIEARDKGDNVTQRSLNLNFTSPPLSKSDFERPFVTTYFNGHLLEALDWYGYNHNDRGLAFDETWLPVLLDFMIPREDWSGLSEAEWSRFIKDFDIRNQSWATWDADRNNRLDDTELYDGLKRLNLFKEWDTNQDKILNHLEIAAGVFSRWDHNQDNVLTREEYMGKFYSYLYSKRE